MAKVKIAGKEYQLKFTIGFWKKVKEACDIKQENLETKLKEDFGNISSLVIYWGIYYGLNPLPGEPPVTQEQIEAELDRSVMDVIEEAIIEGMTKQEKRIVELVRAEKDQELSKLEDSAKKKSQSPNTDS